jgi:hypothetical protein
VIPRTEENPDEELRPHTRRQTALCASYLTNLIYELRRIIMLNTTSEANGEALFLLHGDHQYEVPNKISRQVVADVLVAGGVSREHGYASSGRSWQWLKDVTTLEEKRIPAYTIHIALVKAGFRFLESSRDQPLLHIEHSAAFLTYPESNCGMKNEGRCDLCHTIAYLSGERISDSVSTTRAWDGLRMSDLPDISPPSYEAPPQLLYINNESHHSNWQMQIVMIGSGSPQCFLTFNAYEDYTMSIPAESDDEQEYQSLKACILAASEEDNSDNEQSCM